MPRGCCHGDTTMMNQASLSVMKTADGICELSPAFDWIFDNVVDSSGRGGVTRCIPFNSDGSLAPNTAAWQCFEDRVKRRLTTSGAGSMGGGRNPNGY